MASLEKTMLSNRMYLSLSKRMGDGKVKLGRGPYAISIAILSMYAGFQHPGIKYMIVTNILLILNVFFSCGLQICVEKLTNVTIKG